MQDINYKARYSTIPSIAHYLRMHDIQDVDAFMSPTADSLCSPLLMNNMWMGIERLRLFFSEIQADKKNNPNVYKVIALKIDPDVDGFTSGAYMMRFIQFITAEFGLSRNAGVALMMPHGKEHGLDEASMLTLLGEEPMAGGGKTSDGREAQIDFLIIPDAGCSADDAKKYKRLRDEGWDKPILILDHHPIDANIYSIPKVIAINCTDGRYPHRSLSGVGVVDKFVRAYFEHVPGPSKSKREEFLKQQEELVALGLIADVMDLRNPEARFMSYRGLDHLLGETQNKFIGELEKRCSEGMKHGPTIMGYGWKIAPLLNAVIRMGTDLEKFELFDGLVGTFLHDDVTYTPRRKHRDDPKPEPVTISWEANLARKCGNIKARHDKAVREAVNAIVSTFPPEQETRNFVYLLIEDEIPSTLKGLIAGRLTDIYKRPVMVLTEHRGYLSGSARGYTKGGIESFKQLITEVAEDNDIKVACIGHDNAFGVHMPAESVEALVNALDEPEYAPTVCTPVDYEIDCSDLSIDLIKEFAREYDLWGNGVSEPTFAIKNVRVNAQDIEEIANGWMLKFMSNGVTFVKKYCGKDEYNCITLKDRYSIGPANKNLNITVIGTFEAEPYEDKEFYQIRVKEWSAKEQTSQDMDIDFVF